MDRIERYSIKDLKNIPSKKVFTNFGNGDVDVVELHIYGGDTLISSDLDVDGWKMQSQVRGKQTTRPRVAVDIHNDLREVGFTSGIYKVQYNFFRNILGSHDENHGLHIAEISPSRTELRIKTTSDDEDFLDDIDNLIDKDVSAFIDDNWHDLILNFGNNVNLLAVNWADGGDGDLLLKLYEPLPKDIEVKDQFWLVKEVITSHTEIVQLIPAEKQKQGMNIGGPNFELEINGSNVGETGWETWNSILGTNKENKQQLLNKFVSGSTGFTELNIDYTDYANFIHFSSAKERIENFKYKVELIEYYNSQITQIGLITPASQSTFSNKNVLDYEHKVEEVKNGFDGYEKYLYFESSSYTWPKTNTIEPYILDTVTNTTTWFTSQSNVALDYDTVVNEHNLENTIPFHIREDKDNSNYLLFANMVGQHFDDVWAYIDYSSQIQSRQNKLYEGLSKDLVYNVLSSFGWESYQGFQFTDLWEYSLGVDDTGAYGQATGSLGALSSVSGSTEYRYATTAQQSGSMSREEVSRETWKRMLNNLPYLLKTKGTERGIKSLLSTYGLPPTLLRVFEYGGPQKEKTTDSYIKYDKFSYSLEFDGSNDKVLAPWGKISSSTHPLGGSTDRSPDVMEVRFNTWTATDQIIFNGGDKFALVIKAHAEANNTSSGFYNHGQLRYIHEDSGAIISDDPKYLPYYDNDWWNISISRATASYNSNNSFFINVAKAADHSNGRITHTSSMSTNTTDESNNWNKNLNLSLGGNTSNSIVSSYNRFTGSMQEFRTWIMPYEDQVALDYWNDLTPFHNHTRSPLSIESYGATGSYDQLVTRYSLGADLNRHSSSWGTTTVISGSQPSVNSRVNPYTHLPSFSNTNATCSNFSGDLSVDWPTEEEKYYTAMPDLVGTREISDKVRIEGSELRGRLDVRQRKEKSQFDKAPLDSNRLGVYFAPHFNIDLDIAHDMGGVRFDNYVGNPLDARDDEYKAMRPLRQHYWRKHSNPYDFFDYLKILRHLDHTLFKQIEHLVPARANAQIGLLVKGNMLERPKVKQMNTGIDELHYEGTLDLSNYRIKANTTTLGGPYHRGTKDGKNDNDSALQSHTGYQQYLYEGIDPDGLITTDKSSGAIEAKLNVRNIYGHDLDVDGSRYIWKYMHQYTKDGVGYINPTASMQQGGASYENNGTFLHNTFTDGYYGNSPATVYGVAPGSTEALNAKSGSTLVSQEGIVVTPFNDFGNIPNYHHQRMSRLYKKVVYHYFAPKNNLGTSGSTGGVTTTATSSGYEPGPMYRSGLNPVSKSYEFAEVSDFRPNATNNLYFGGCKLVGSDFNMPVLQTVDGGPVVEFTDTNPNAIIVTGRTAGGGDLIATGQVLQK